MNKGKRKLSMFAVIMIVMAAFIVLTYGLLTTDAFIDVGEINEMAGNDTTRFDKSRVINESAGYIEGLFASTYNDETDTGENSLITGDGDSADGSGVWTGETVDTTQDGITSDGTGSVTDTDVYTCLVNNGIDTSKAYAMSYAYEATKDVYGHNFAVGLMANVLQEARCGLVEYNKPVPNWNGDGISATSTPSAPLTISSAQNAQACIDAGVNVSIGIGMCQWSYERRIALANLYIANATDYSEADIARIEVNFMLQELNSGYSHVVAMCEGKSAEECARNICLYYEAPSDKKIKAEERAGLANLLLTYIGG